MTFLHLPDVPSWLAGLSTLTALAVKSPVPWLRIYYAVRRWWMLDRALSKGVLPVPNLEQVQQYITEARDLAKLALQVIPGTPADKAAKLNGLLQPAAQEELAKLGVSPFVAAFLVKLLELVVNEEVAAIAA